MCEALWEHRFHLGASLARERIKASTPSVAGLLPTELQEVAMQVTKQPVSARVNHLHAGEMGEAEFSNDVIQQLVTTWGLKRVDGGVDPRVLSSIRQSFWVEPGDVPELLVFSEDCKNKLAKHRLVSTGTLVFQVGCCQYTNQSGAKSGVLILTLQHTHTHTHTHTHARTYAHTHTHTHTHTHVHSHSCDAEGRLDVHECPF